MAQSRVACFAPARGQTVILNDSFNDGSRLDGTDPDDASWYMSHPDLNLGGTAPGISTKDAAPLSGPTLSFGGTSTFAYGVASFTSVTLSQPGDRITITADFAIAGATTSSTLYGPIIGLFDHGGTPLTADITSLTAATADDVGFELIYERGLSGDLFFVPVSNASPAADFAYEVRNPALTWDANAVATDQNGHRLELTLTLGPNSASLIVTATLDGFVGASQVYSGPILPLTFNEAIVSSWSGSTGYIDNIRVTFTPVPEPSAYALFTLGGALVGLARWRRHRTRG